MKTARKLILIFVTITILNSCSKDEVSGVNNESVEVEGILNLNYESLKVVTLSGEAIVDKNGGFNADVSTTITEDLPIIFTKDNEIMFGYYSKTGPNGTIAIDDILLFFFTAHPEVAIQGLSNKELLSMIKSSSNYSELKALMVKSLESNLSPFKNSSFIEKLNASGYKIAIDNRGYRYAMNERVDNVFEFAYTYSRNGKISWNKEFPLFATVGMEITNNQSSDSKIFLFDQEELVRSPQSFLFWLVNYFTTSTEELTESFQFQNNGEYTITFTNGVDGVGSIELESKVDSANRLNVGLNIFSAVFPIGIKFFVKNDCKEELTNWVIGLDFEAIKAALTGQYELKEVIFEMSNDVYDVIKKCNPIKYNTYLNILNGLNSFFSKVEDVSLIFYLIRDYLLSDISGEETRYFYNGISYGGLTLTNVSGELGLSPKTEFVGEPESQHIYRGLLTEDVFKYLIQRDVTINSVVTKQTEQGDVDNFPFLANKLSGDATQLTNSSTTVTDQEGKMEMTFKMGTQESQFEIKPAINGNGLPNTETILLVNQEVNETLKLLTSKTWSMYKVLDGYGNNFYWCADNTNSITYNFKLDNTYHQVACGNSYDMYYELSGNELRVSGPAGNGIHIIEYISESEFIFSWGGLTHYCN